MKKILIVLFILFARVLPAQPVPGPSIFDEFINKPAIEWAAYANYNIRFERPALNKILLSRYEKNEIKASQYTWSSTRHPYLPKNSLDEIIFNPHGDRPGGKGPDFDTASFTMTDVTQVFYIEKGKLKSYTAWVSPLIPIITSSGKYLGDGGYFSTCFNFKYNYSPGKRTAPLFLSQTRLILKPDSIGTLQRLKELYGRNLVQTLWPYIINGDIEVYSAETNSRLNKDEINTYLVKKTNLPAPVYDTAAATTGFQLPEMSFDPKNIIKLELVQDWYYEQKENLVYNKIREMYLYALIPVSEEDQGKPAPLLKIVFN
jgi:hypothetical protein